ncbi:MAG: serine hydrolase [Chitinophagaceae bacterium]|nr:serine hydrolase [Chitinophagaceae bacterium]
MKGILFLLFWVVLSVKATAQSDAAGRLDSLFQSLYRHGQINGNVLAAEKGHIVYSQSFGYADFPAKRPNAADSRFSIGSVSKIFTSIAVLQLKEKGKLRLDDPLVKYLPAFRYPNITVRHLLSHTSGLPDYELYGKLVDENPDKVFFNTDILPSLNLWEKPLYFQPGEKWQYSNTNFSLLALLVEKISRMRFQDYVKKEIFGPAKMLNTYFLTDTMQLADKNRVSNYQYPALFASEPQEVSGIRKVRWRLYNLSGFVGQGNIITSAGDMLNFDQALYAGKLLKAATLEEAFTPTRLNNGENVKADIGVGKASYGLGWFIFTDTSAGKIVWHGGGVPGAVAIFLRNITQKQVVIVLDNAFSEGIYQNGVNALRILDHQPVVSRKKSLTQDYGSDLVKRGVDAAFCRLFQLRADSAHYYMDEAQMNLLAYQLLYEASFENHQLLALEVFKINTLLFPSSYNVYDSYGEALFKNGYRQEAISMYRKALELNPQNAESEEALRRILGN